MGKNIFNSVQLEKPKKNVFDLSHDVKMSMKMGRLTPVLVTECVPGDSFQIGCDSLIRFAPMVAPVMHRMDVSVHYFFVPNRITWENWEKFIVDANTPLVAPYINSDWLEPGQVVNVPTARKFADYMGVPPPDTSTTVTQLNALPLAAYQAIYNEYYRDENLNPEVDYKLTDGNNAITIARANELLSLRNRAWEHDYFTASLPFAQKGTAVDIPIGSIDNDVAVNWNSLENAHTSVTYDAINSQVIGTSAGVSTIGTPEMIAKTSDIDIQPTTINDLRRAFRLQEWLE